MRRANDLIARIEDGLVGTDIGDGTLTGVDLAPDTFVPGPAHPSRSTATPIGSHRKRSRMSAGAPASSRSIAVAALAEVLPALVVDRDRRARADQAAELDRLAGRSSCSAAAR